MIPYFYEVLIVTGVASSIGYFFLRLWYNYRKETMIQVKKENKNKASQDMETQLNDIIDNAPRIKAEIDSQIEQQRAKGVTDQQMSGLMMYKQIVDLAASNPQLAQIIGKPLVKGLVGIVAKIPKIIGGLTSL